jgi:Flp pilus assembly protein TadG
MGRWPQAGGLIARFGSDRRGNILLMFCFLSVGLVLLAGGAVDLSRAVMLRSALQNAADAAALAGATNFSSAAAFSARQAVATDYMNASLARLPDRGDVTFTVSPFATDSNGTTTAYNVKIAAIARLKTTFMALLVDTIPVSVVATATYPLAAGNGDDGGDDDSSSSLPSIMEGGDDPQLYTSTRSPEAGVFGPELAGGAHLTQ